MKNIVDTSIEDSKIIEIILFVENKPLSVDSLRRMAGMKEDNVLSALRVLKEKYDGEGHGIELEVSEEGYAFAPKKEYYDRLKKTYGKKVDTRLTRATLETLSIIAYQQQITRREIDAIRGVSSENIIKLLRERGFIKVVGRSEKEIGHPCLYGTTKKFLYEFNLASIADLPKLDDYDSERYEEKDGEGNVLTARLIKKKMKDGASANSPAETDAGSLEHAGDAAANGSGAGEGNAGSAAVENDDVIVIDEDEVSAEKADKSDSASAEAARDMTDGGDE